MTSEAPESTSPITVTETEHAVRTSTSSPITADCTAESIGEQAIVEDLMVKQAYRIETSFMAAMDRFSLELLTFFQERMPVTSSATPPRARQRGQERERFEPYGESSSLGVSGRAQALNYGQHSQPPTKSCGQSQSTWVNPEPTYPEETTYGPLHALAVSLGQSSPAQSAVQQLGPVHTGRPDPSRPKQLDRYFVTAIRSEQSGRFTITYIVVAVRLPSSVRFDHSNYESYKSRSNLRRISGTTQLGRNGRTPRSSGPAGEAAERGATSPTASRSPARGTPSGAPIRRRPANDRGRPGSEAPGSAKTSSIEHIGRFTSQCGEADSDAQKLRLFDHSLTGAAFSWFINLPPNSVRDWSDMERIFHEHFYQTNREITVPELARMSQASDESPHDYLQRFKTCRNWCRTNLPEREFVKMAEEGLEFEYRKKF
ncbi:unnamed protein product [Prunus armeniaca]